MEIVKNKGKRDKREGGYNFSVHLKNLQLHSGNVPDLPEPCSGTAGTEPGSRPAAAGTGARPELAAIQEKEKCWQMLAAGGAFQGSRNAGYFNQGVI